MRWMIHSLGVGRFLTGILKAVVIIGKARKGGQGVRMAGQWEQQEWW